MAAGARARDHAQRYRPRRAGTRSGARESHPLDSAKIGANASMSPTIRVRRAPITTNPRIVEIARFASARQVAGRSSASRSCAWHRRIRRLLFQAARREPQRRGRRRAASRASRERRARRRVPRARARRCRLRAEGDADAEQREQAREDATPSAERGSCATAPPGAGRVARGSRRTRGCHALRRCVPASRARGSRSSFGLSPAGAPAPRDRPSPLRRRCCASAQRRRRRGRVGPFSPFCGRVGAVNDTTLRRRALICPPPRGRRRHRGRAHAAEPAAVSPAPSKVAPDAWDPPRAAACCAISSE